MQNQQPFCAPVGAANRMPVAAHLGISARGLTTQKPMMTTHQNANANVFSLANLNGGTSSGIMPYTSGGTVFYTSQADLLSTNSAYQEFSNPLVVSS